MPLPVSAPQPRNSVVASRSPDTALLRDRGRPSNTKLLHPVRQRRSLHTQARGCATLSADHPVARFQCTKDMIALHLGETIHRGIGPDVRLGRLQFGGWRAQRRLRRENHGAFDKVLQFADVSGPWVSRQRIHRIRRDSVNSFVHALRVECCEMPYQSRNILCALSQRRNLDRKYFQTIIKVLAKGPLFHHRGQVPMGGGDQPHVNLMRAVASEPLEFLFLQDAQQFRLKFQWYVANLVKKQRAFVGQLEPSRFLSDGACKCSFFVAKQLTLEESKRDCGAIQFHESLLAATAEFMYCTRNEFFAGPGLSQDQHTGIRRGHYRDQAQRGLERRALADDFAKPSANFLFEVEPLFRFFISILCSLFILQCVLNGNRYLTGHLLEQDDVVFIKCIVRTPRQHQNANHAISANQRKITPRPEAFLDHSLVKKLAVGIPINFRILAGLCEAVDAHASGLPQYVTGDRTVHRHERSLAEGSSRVAIV